MSIDVTIGIIGGNGWLGSAIASAAIASGAVEEARLCMSTRSDLGRVTAFPKAHWTNSNAELVERADVVVLSVRPDQFEDVRIDAKGKLVVSAMAGVTAAAIAERTGASAIVRSMPNAAAAIGRSFTPWHATPSVSSEGKLIVQALFAACGDAVEVAEESHIDYCAGMSGTGAAYPALLAQALIEHAVSQGLPRDFAERAATGVVAGASQLLAEPGANAGRIVQEMIDYRGLTAAALLAMRGNGFDAAVASGIDAAVAMGAAIATSRP